MNYKNYIICEDILGLQTNSDYLGWSFGHPTISSTEDALNRCLIILRLFVDPLDKQKHETEKWQKYHYWKGSPSEDALFYEREFFAGTKLRLWVKGLKTNNPELVVNKNFIRFIRFRFNNLHSPGYILTDLACALMLGKGYCPLHCSAFATKNAAIAVVAPGNTGKTLATMRAVFDANATYMSEDVGVVDEASFYACPWTSTFRYYDELSMSRILRWRMKLIKIFPPAELIPVPGSHRNIDFYIGKERIAARKKLTHIAFLARRPGGVKTLDKDTATKMLINLNRYEFYYMKSPMLTAYSYFNPEIDMFDLELREQEILKKLVGNTTCLLVQNEDPTQFARMILEHTKD